MDDNIIWPICIVVFLALMSRSRKRDHYVVVVEYRIVEPDEFGKGKKIENRQVFAFDDFSAGKAFYDLHNTYAAIPYYENQQNINYLYAVPSSSTQQAADKMKKENNYQAKLLAETPQSVLFAIKKHWDEERRDREIVRQDGIDTPQKS